MGNVKRENSGYKALSLLLRAVESIKNRFQDANTAMRVMNGM